MRMWSIFLLATLAVLAGVRAVTADATGRQTVSVATLGLRGGYDANPANVHGAPGSGFVSQSATWGYLRGSDREGYAISLAVTNTVYESRLLSPATSSVASFRHAMTLAANLILRSSVATTTENSWSRRLASVLWSERLDFEQGPVRLFASLDARFASLNERNIFALGNFLPAAENFVTLSALPGLALRQGWGEVGVSLLAARTTFRFQTDYLGLRRDNDRIHANLFASAEVKGIKLEGSLALAHARFRVLDFENITRLLYTAKVTVPLDRIGLPIRNLSLALSSARTLEDTTLPFSVYNLMTLSDARLTATINERDSLALVARHKSDEYLGLGARSTLLSFGMEYERAFGEGLAGAAALSWRRVRDTGGPAVSAVTVQLGLNKRIDLLRAPTVAR
jgi:hypothetical protein